MPYDPNIPINGDIVDADELRAQFAAVHAETVAANARIDALPAGPPGPEGPVGPAGEPFAQAIVDGVTTLDPEQPAAVQVNFDGANVRFSFGIPRGEDGLTGPPGEVSQAQLADVIATAVAGTARNPTEVPAFDGGFSDPPTQGEMQAFAAWAETFRASLVRSA